MENLNSLKLSNELRNGKGIKNGFTLIEVIAVIAIIGILAAIIVPNILQYTKNAKKARAVDDARQVVSFINAWNTQRDDEGTGIIVYTQTLEVNGTPDTTATGVIGTGAAIKEYPRELIKYVDTYDKLERVADKTKYVSGTPGSGQWSVDLDGTVILGS